MAGRLWAGLKTSRSIARYGIPGRLKTIGAKTMMFEQTDERRREICEAWGLYRESDPLAQMTKLQEELNELKSALLEADYKEIVDAIGDMTVVLGNIATMVGTTIPHCYETAVEVISKRNGQIINGVFVKDES